MCSSDLNLSDYTLSNHIGTGNSYSEIVKVWVDDQKIYLGFERESFYGPLTLPVRNITMKSTIFYNPNFQASLILVYPYVYSK